MCWELVKDGEKSKSWLNLDEVKIYTEGGYKGKRNWKNSIGKKIGVRYQWINDEMEEKWLIVKKYKHPHLTLIDENENKLICFHISNFYEGQFGKKIFDKKTDKFKYNINDIINNLIIIDREYRKSKQGYNLKWYKYQCLKCGNIDWMVECDLKKGTSCNVCCSSPQKVAKGVNDIATTHPHLCKYFVNQEDTYNYTVSSGMRVLLKCPNCKHQKEMKLNTFTTHGFGCNKCGDGTSYPEKFMANILTQLNIKFETQLSKTTFKWCDTYFYDFYLSDYNIIIETHGLQHYEDAFYTYEDTHENDLIKYDLAVLNGFEYNKNYFIIDSRESTLEWMKENIRKELGYLFDLSNIDWEKADLESQKSHMILACQLKRENPDLTTIQIIELVKKETNIKYGNCTIIRWLNRGNKLGLCCYNGKEEAIKAHTGKEQSEETRKKIGKTIKEKETSKGSKNPRARKIISVDPFTKQSVFTWQYKKQATEFYGISISTLNCYLKGKRKSGHLYNGFLWYYEDEYEQMNK